MLPKYALFKIHDPAANKEMFTTKFRRQPIDSQVAIANVKIHHLKTKIASNKEIVDSSTAMNKLTKILPYLTEMFHMDEFAHK